MAGVEVRLISSGVAALLNSGEVRAYLHTLAEEVLSNAQSRSPLGDPAGGHYQDRFVIEDDTTDRAVVRIGNTSDYAAEVESRYQVLGGSF